MLLVCLSNKCELCDMCVYGENSQDCISREVRGALSEQRELFSAGFFFFFFDIVFVTWFPTNVETSTTPVLAIPMFIVSGSISLFDW